MLRFTNDKAACWRIQRLPRKTKKKVIQFPGINLISFIPVIADYCKLIIEAFLGAEALLLYRFRREA